MPSEPTFNYYAELQVETEASQLEITSSYRRLARIHHPDKNPDNQQAATAAFQRLQIAYETLSDPTKRIKYDDMLTPRRPPFFESDDDDDDEDEDDEYGYYYDDFNTFRSGRNFNSGSRRGAAYASFEEMDFLFREAEMNEAGWRARNGFFYSSPPRYGGQMYAAQQEAARQELRERQEAEAVRQQARKAAKEAAAAAAQEKKDRCRGEEALRQASRWTELRAVTKDERRETCLHSEFCTKVEQSKKFKCAACGAKRGRTAFECPHCAVFLCQLCVTSFTQRRAKAGDTGKAKAGWAFTEEASSEGKRERTTCEDSEHGQASPVCPEDTPSSASPESGSFSDQPFETNTSRTGTTTEDPIIEEGSAHDPVGQAEKESSESTSGKDTPTISGDTSGQTPASQGTGDATGTQGNKKKGKARAKMRKTWTDGPDPGYNTQGRHIRCLQYHKGGDDKCFMMHPELRARRNQNQRKQASKGSGTPQGPSC